MARWSKERAWAWYQAQPWLMGANYVPSDAVNDVEMWRGETFNPALIQKELSWAAELGMNTVRVFLSYTVWLHEEKGFLDNFEKFLTIAAACGHRVLPILFDDCAFDHGSEPFYGPQLPPVPGVHNSRWVPSPGQQVQDDPSLLSSCRDYLAAVIGPHREDARIVAWDLYNEPGNNDRHLASLPLLVEAFRWARALEPVQPLTSCLWCYDDSWLGMNSVIAQLSDIVNLHTYQAPEISRSLIEAAQKNSGRPVIVTEWLHRPNGDTILTNLPYYQERKIGVWQWGLVNGRTQTHYNWTTMKNPDTTPPPLWQHDLLHADGTPYIPEETALMKKLTEKIK